MTQTQEVILQHAMELKRIDTNKTLKECVEEIISAMKGVK